MISKIALVSLLIASIVFVLPSVHGQATRIVELRHPIQVTAGDLEPFVVEATVSYQDAKPGYSLVISILDMSMKPQKVVPGIVSAASPAWCVNQPVLAALCIIKTNSSSGIENLEFRIGGILGGEPQGSATWALNITTELLDSNNNLIERSASSVPFGINLIPLSLTITVPSVVRVSVDGVEQPPGPVTVGVAAGNHNMSLPPITYVDNGTRLKFDHWADGSSQMNRSISVRSASSFEAIYVTQYGLTLVNELGNATGAGWYDEGSTASYSIANSVESMKSLPGLLGGSFTFQGWYEGENLVANSTAGTIVMNQPHTLTVQWQANYIMPLAISATVVVAVLAVSAYLVTRRKAAATASTAENRS